MSGEGSVCILFSHFFFFFLQFPPSHLHVQPHFQFPFYTFQKERAIPLYCPGRRLRSSDSGQTQLLRLFAVLIESGQNQIESYDELFACAAFYGEVETLRAWVSCSAYTVDIGVFFFPAIMGRI